MVDITHLAMEIDVKTSDHVVAMEKVVEQCTSTDALNPTVFKLQVILLIMEGTEKSKSSFYSLSF